MRRWQAFLLLLLVAWLLWDSQQRRQPEMPARESQTEVTHKTPPVSAPADAGAAMKKQPSVPTTREQPSVLKNAPSVEEVLSLRDASGVQTRTTIYKTTFKYPYLRVEASIMRNERGQDVITRQRTMVADHLMIKAREGVTKEALQAHVAPLGAGIRRQVGRTDIYLIALKSPAVKDFDHALSTWKQGDALIEHAEPDFIAMANAAPLMPNDTQFSQQWNMHNTGTNGDVADADIDAPEAWGVTTGSASVTLGVIDTGIDLTHPDLQANLWTNPGETGGGKETDGIDNDSNGYIDDVHGWNFAAGTNNPDDDNGHGSHVAGTIGAVGGNSNGIAGVCHTVRLMALKFLDASGSGTDSDAIEAIQYATAMGALATNNSWGGSDYSLTMQQAIEAAGAAGSGFIAAAGNDGTNNDVIPQYPCNFPVANIISVAATDSADVLAWFSCYGKTTVHLGAPGFQTYSTTKDGGYALNSGTSMATPHVTGAVGLLKAANPNLTFADIKTMLIATVDPLPSMTTKSISGGRLNLAKALVPATEASLKSTGLTIDDTLAGNGDGVASPGETVNLLIPIKNVGAALAQSVSASLALTNPDPQVTITQSTATYGDIAFNSTTNNTATPFTVVISAAKATVDVPLTFTISSGSQTWTESLTLRVRTVATLAGTVTRLSGGTPIENATITISGPENHTLQTDASGHFTLQVTNGVYTITAGKTGYIPSQPQYANVPPSATALNFVLGFSGAQVSPQTLSATLSEGATSTQTFTITNNGDQAMTYSIEQAPAAPATISSALQLSPPDASYVTPAALTQAKGFHLPDSPHRRQRILDASDDTDVIIPWTDNFEDGHWGRWYPTSNYGVRQVLTGNAGEGSKSFEFEHNGTTDEHINGIHEWFNYGTKPGYISFWTRPGQRDLATSYVLISDLIWVLDSNGFHAELVPFIWFFGNANGRFYLNDDVGGNQLVAFNEDEWYKVEFRNVNWTTFTFDYWVNDQLVQSAVPMRSPEYASSGMTLALAYNYSSGTKAGWDGFKFYDDALPWLSLSTSQGSIAPGQSVTVTVTFDATKQLAGDYSGRLLVKTNDPVTPTTTVNVGMTVNPTPNQIPTADPQTLSLALNETKSISLTGTDADNEALTFQIISLPTNGKLYQTTDGIFPTYQITSTPKVVSNTQQKVIFIPDTGEHGTPYATFQFSTKDAKTVSAPATVTVNVNQFPTITVSPAGSTFSQPVLVSISATVSGGEFRITTDGTEPTLSSMPLPNPGSIKLDRSTTLKVAYLANSSLSPAITNTYTFADTDNDGLPDWWEAQAPGGAATVDPQADPDGNGLTAEQEYIAGIAPGAKSGFTGSVAVVPGATMTFSWPTATGRLYQAESSLDAKTWQPVGSLYWGSGGVMAVQVPASEQPTFFRVRATLP